MKLNTEDKMSYYGKIFLPPCHMRVWGEGFSLRVGDRIMSVNTGTELQYDQVYYCPLSWVMT